MQNKAELNDCESKIENSLRSSSVSWQPTNLCELWTLKRKKTLRIICLWFGIEVKILDMKTCAFKPRISKQYKCALHVRIRAQQSRVWSHFTAGTRHIASIRAATEFKAHFWDVYTCVITNGAQTEGTCQPDTGNVQPVHREHKHPSFLFPTEREVWSHGYCLSSAHFSSSRLNTLYVNLNWGRKKNNP